jgi:flagella basal body P-ring formation protein FlgA
LDGAFNLIIPSASSEIILPHDQPQSVEIVSLNYNAAQNRFEAQLAAPSKADQVRSLTVHGNVQRLMSIPVLRSTLRNGDVIGQRDIDYLEVPLTHIKHNVILDPQDLIGMTPRRVLITDKPIKTDDIEAPRIVSRGENVTMIFKQGGLVLTAQGKAMQFGSKGDHIRVTNLNSSKTVEATVSGVKEVTVHSF